MANTKKFYIKERHNPQFKNPYYIGCGKLSPKEAKAKETSTYGTNYMLPYDTEEEYETALNDFKSQKNN